MMNVYSCVYTVGLSFILYCLAVHKEHQEKCRKEIREILAGRESDDITW